MSDHYVNPATLDDRVGWPRDLEESTLPGAGEDATTRVCHVRDVFAAAVLPSGRMLIPKIVESGTVHPWVRVIHPSGIGVGEYRITPYPDAIRVDWQPYTRPPVTLTETMVPSMALSVVLDHICGVEPSVPGRPPAADQ